MMLVIADFDSSRDSVSGILQSKTWVVFTRTGITIVFLHAAAGLEQAEVQRWLSSPLTAISNHKATIA